MRIHVPGTNDTRVMLGLAARGAWAEAVGRGAAPRQGRGLPEGPRSTAGGQNLEFISMIRCVNNADINSEFASCTLLTPSPINS